MRILPYGKEWQRRVSDNFFAFIFTYNTKISISNHQDLLNKNEAMHTLSLKVFRSTAPLSSEDIPVLSVFTPDILKEVVVFRNGPGLSIREGDFSFLIPDFLYKGICLLIFQSIDKSLVQSPWLD